MSNVNAVRFLSDSSDDTALANKVYWNKFTSAPRSGVFLWNNPMGLITRDTVNSGKSYQFLMGSDVPEPEEFTPGNEVMGQVFNIEEGTITTDKYIVCHKWIPRDQMKWSHFKGILEDLATKHVRRLEREMDKRVFIQAVRAARTAALNKPTTASGEGYNIHNGGNRVTRAVAFSTDSITTVRVAYPASSTGAANFRADTRQLARLMDVDNIDPDRRALWINPYMRESLLYDTTATLFSRDYQDANKVNERMIPVIDGFKIMGFPNRTEQGGPMPSETLVHTNSKFAGAYAASEGDTTYGEPVAIALCGGMDGETAVGVIEYENVQNFVGYYPEKFSWLVMSYMLNGVGPMHPWCAGVIEVTDNA